MDGEAQGKASHGCMSSKPVACLGLMGSGSGLLSQLWGGGHHTEGSTGDPSSLSSDLAPALSVLPGTCLPQTLFPALKAES